MNALTVRGLSKAFASRPVLSGMDLEIPHGGFTAVLGPSGCGKTTLLRLIAGFERPDAGTIILDGNVVSEPGRQVAPERRHFGYVAQEGALFPHLNVGANIAFGLSRAQRRAGRVQEMLDLVGLAELEHRMPDQLSGGQQQRVALARALAPDPAVMLLDEPFSALDAGMRAGLRADVRRALEATGATALLVTHDQTEALSLADEVAIMRDGRLVQIADPGTLYSRPIDPAVASFVGDAILLPAHLHDGLADCALGRLSTSAEHPCANGRGTVMIRPEQLICTPAADGSINGQVLETTYYGHDADVTLALVGVDSDVRVTARQVGSMVPPIGTHVAIDVTGDVVAYGGPSQPSRISQEPAGEENEHRPRT